MATMFIYDSTTFYAARVRLGVAEAGFFPGIVLEAVLIMSLKLPGQAAHSADRSVQVPADGHAHS